MKRTETTQIRVGKLFIGGDAPVTVQSMCNTKTWDVEATVTQIRALRAAGVDKRSKTEQTCPLLRIFILIIGWHCCALNAASIRSVLIPGTSAEKRTSRLWQNHAVRGKFRSVSA